MPGPDAIDSDLRTPRPTTPSWRATYLGSDTRDGSANISWGSVLAGVVTFLALIVTFSLIGTAIGLGGVDPASDNPLDGVGTGLTIWAVLTLLVSLAGAGFVSGVLAVRAGFMHGVVTWATGVIAFVVLLGLLASAAFGAIGSLVSGAASTVGGAASSVADLAGDGVNKAIDGVTDQLGDIDAASVDQQTQDILVGTGVPELQPGYLQDQVDAAGTEISDAGVDLLTNPDDADTILDDLTTSLEDRVTTITDAVDRDAITRSVAENTDLTGAEAEEAVSTIEQGLQAAGQSAQDMLDGAASALADARETISEQIDQARQTADEISDSAARAAGWVFAGLILGLAVTAFAALLGSRLVVGRNAAGRVTRQG